MTEHRTRRELLAGGATAALGLAGCVGGGDDTSAGGSAENTGDGGAPASTPTADSMTIFHAGSLAPPFSAAEPRFEDEFGVDVTREAKGSVASTQKITQQRRSADVLGTSDFRLIRNRVLPEFGDWYAIFTTNSMSIQYRADSPGADEISEDNWWEVLSRDGVTVGHSDPAVDPGGYRAVMLDGRIVQRGSPEAVFERPRSPTVARFTGSNVVDLSVAPSLRRVLGDGVGVGAGVGSRAQADGSDRTPVDRDRDTDTADRVAIRPEAITLGGGDVSATVERVVCEDATSRVTLAFDGVTVEAFATSPPAVGAEVSLGFPPDRLHPC